MASREEWCSEQLAKLLQDDLRISTLNEIKDHLSTVPQDEAARTAKVLDLPLVFDCLNNSDSEQIDLACEVLELCMSNLSLGESTNRYGVSLERALKHPHAGVKVMTLKEIERNVRNEAVLLELCKRVSLFSAIIRCIGDEELSVSKKASDIVLTIGKHPVGLKQLLSPDLLAVIHEVMAISEIVRLRVYEVVVNICKESDDHFNMIKPTGILTELLGELDSNDVLLRMNVVELLSQLGLCKHGYNYLEGCNILEKQMKIFDDVESDPVTLQLCGPGVLKFFGHIAHWKPLEVLSKYPKVMDFLLSTLESDDFTILGVTYDVIGHIGSTNEGKCALDSLGGKFEKAVSTIAKNISSSPTEIKVRALSCIENLLKVIEFNSQITNLTRKWYHQIDDNPMSFILRYAKNPFFELRLAGFKILHALGEQNWGQQEIRDTPGLVEFLMDRNIENKKECKEAKYNICKILATSNVFDHLTRQRLEHFVKEGPFFVETITEVAIEGND